MNKTETSLIQVNRRGFSKQDLVQSLQILERMAKYDFENRIGSKSRSQDQDDVSLDMKFFEHFRGKIEMCLPIDPNLCGNLEVRGKLKTMLPEDLKHAQDRVAACRENFEKFCMKMFGENYQWIHYVTSEVCGDSTFSREKGANKVTYSAVTTYKGESDSILGTTFVISGAAALYLGHADDCGIAQHFQLFVRGVVHSIHAEFRSNFCQLRPKDGGEQLSHQPQDLRCALHWDSQRCHRSGCPGCWCQIPICYQQSARPCLEYNRFSAECQNTVFYLQSSPK